jgi:F0F1-type ATP synthase assembly protein I
VASSASGDPQNEPRDDTDAADGTPGESAPDKKKDRAARARTEAESRAPEKQKKPGQSAPLSGGHPEPASPADKEQAKKGRDDGNPWRMMGLGLQLTVTVLVFLAAGRWVDEKLGWTPWGQTVLGMLGVAAGLYWMLKDADR